MRGFLLIDKAEGPTSHDVVAQLRRSTGCRRVGHCGTLDPGAAGLLVIVLGEATRLARFATGLPKEYRVKALLGVETSTDDAQGEVVEERATVEVTEAQVREVLERFRGTLEQVPPMVSAVHFEGRRLYQLARQGQSVERPGRQIEVSELELIQFESGDRPVLDLRMVVSAGTYVRTLCADIGRALGVPAHAASLRRTRIGSWKVEEALPLDEALRRAAERTLEQAVIPIEEADLGIRRVTLPEEGVSALLRGASVRVLPKQRPPAPEEFCLAVGPSGRAVALCRGRPGGGPGVVVSPERLLVGGGVRDES
jgi:tRNA pseudouridine55 synthase